MVTDKMFSLGLSYYQIMDLKEEQLHHFLTLATREEVIDWLQWNDPNGTYTDTLSISEFGEILSKSDGIEIIKAQLSN
jgi:hypothetical protein